MEKWSWMRKITWQLCEKTMGALLKAKETNVKPQRELNMTSVSECSSFVGLKWEARGP